MSRAVADPVAVRESTSGVIARQLRSAVMSGELPPGTQLGEVALASQLGVSRGPLREAMQRLVQEGIVRSEPNRGLFVIEFDSADIRDIYLARVAVEKAAVSALLDHGDVSTAVSRLEEAFHTMVEVAKLGDLDALSDADLAFYEILVDSADSPRLRRMYDTLVVETRMCLTELQRSCADPVSSLENHRTILDALRARDRERLWGAVTKNGEDSLDRLVGPDTPDDQPVGEVSSGRR